MVALSAWPFCSSQYWTVLSSWMRLSTSSTESVGATQFDRLGRPGTAPPPGFAPPARFFKKSKPGTNWLKAKGDVASLMGVSGCGFASLLQRARNSVGDQCLCMCAGAAPAGAIERTGAFSESVLFAPCASWNCSVSGIVVSLATGCFRSISIR